MANRTSAALIAAIFAIAGPASGAMAQETPAPAAEAPAPAAPAPAPAEAPANGEPKVGQPYAKETHGDWTLRCMKTEDGKDPCELYQLLKDKDGNAVAETSILPMSGKVQAVITFVAPLETDLQAGLGLQIDSAKMARYPFMLCAPVGCISRIGMTDAELAPLKKGSKATVSVAPFGAPKDQPVNLSLSLSGLTKGLDALIAANKDVAQPAAAPKP